MPLDLNRYPYFDDYNEDNMFYRLLFQPGRSVQARELTQIQSLLQNQIEAIGKHLFKDGSLVFGGKINYDRTTTKWLAVKSQDDSGNPVRIRDMYPGLIIRNPVVNVDSEFTAKITNVIPAEANDPDTIYFKWYPNEPESDTEGFLPNQILQLVDATSGKPRYKVRTYDVNSQGTSVHYGTSSHISVEPGIYYWKGLFVKSNGGSLTLSKYSRNTTYRIGYVVNEEIDQSDPRSLDPASHASNYSAPGADRYKIRLDLIKVGNGVTMDDRVVPNFIEIGRIENGNFLGSSDDLSRSVYSILGDELAKRTYDESGNYTVEDYDLKLSNKGTTDNPKMTGKMSKGVAYVGGYRHSLNYQNSLDIDKGRDSLTEHINLRNAYGDNFVLVYNEANTINTTHPDNANGLFVVGSGAGQYQSSAEAGERGAAVSIHCVPQQLVKDYSLSREEYWNSTLVGTARPIQMVYNRTASNTSAQNGRTGDVYNLWLGDFKGSPVTNTVAAANRITNVSGYKNTQFVELMFNSGTSGLNANDRISVTGSTAEDWNFDNAPVVFANSTAVVVNASPTSANPGTDSLTIYRTTGNTNYLKTVVLDDYSAPWNGSYIGSTISVNGSAPVKIVDYIGTDHLAETLYNTEYGFSRRGMAILEDELDRVPELGDTYTINMGMKQARSVVYNQNKSATGGEQYPAALHQSWNIDPISGIQNGSQDFLTSGVYGQRIDGDCLYNQFGETPDGEDALLFPAGREAVKSFMTHGAVDSGLSGNTTVYYTESCVKTQSGGSASATLDFAVPDAARYKFFDRPAIYPYEGNLTTTDTDLIREHFILVNRTTGQNLTRDVTQVVVTQSSFNIEITLSSQFQDTQSYVLLFPVRAKEASPAYKKLVKGNQTTSHISDAAVQPTSNDLTDLDQGHVMFTTGTYGTTAGSRFSLKVPDGFKLHKVVDDIQNNTANAGIADTDKDITSRFDFDSGQRDMFYDNASLVLKEDVDAPTGNVLAIFDYFQRMNGPKSDSSRTEELYSPGFFSVDSYQWTTDLTLDHGGSSPFVPGMRVVSNTGVSAYVVDYANTAGFSKVRLQDVTAPPGGTATFTVGNFIDGFSTALGATISGRITEIVDADLSYSDIPVYKSRGKVAYPLRNHLDFRTYAVTNTMVSETLSDSMMSPIPTRRSINAGRPDVTASMTSNAIIDHFAGRTDKVIVTADGNYTTIKGSPSTNPYPPVDPNPKEALTLFTVQIPPYTFDTRDVQIKPNISRRHTMKDIGRLAKRVENLEYYVSLDALEKAASELDITFADGTSRFKNGIIVDNFTGMGVIDTETNQSSLGKGVCRPQQIWDYETITVHPHTPNNVKIIDRAVETIDGEESYGGSVIQLDYDIETLVEQPIATTVESVNPFDLQNFTGTLKLTPDKDTWMDVTTVPEYTSYVSGILDNLASIDDNSTAAEVLAQLRTMDELWEEVSGAGELGDEIQGTAYYNPDETLQTQEVARNISLGSVKFFNTTQIDAAIANHGMMDGVTRNLRILPYLRPRDILVHAEGLRPTHLNNIMFDGVSLERYFGKATKIFMQYNPKTDDKFQPDIDGRYEKVKLSGGSVSANGILIATRRINSQNRDAKTATDNLRIGYVVPVFDGESGKVDYSTYKDGYYSSGWNSNAIRDYGWNGIQSRTVTSYARPSVSATLTTGGTTHKYNGHYTGTCRNTSSNTTHIHLSEDAGRYVANNFRNENMTYDTGVPLKSKIYIVAGTGAGQECVANAMLYKDGNEPVIQLQMTQDGKTGLTTGISSDSIYTIGMKPVHPEFNNIGVTQVSDTPSLSNHYGEKAGILHLPSSNRVRFTNGRKLVEIFDRYSKEEWLISSYASAYYYAEGNEREEVQATTHGLELLQEIRSGINAFRVDDHPETLGYVPAVNNTDGTRGKLAVVTGITVANGEWTADTTDGITFVQGGGELGTVSFAEQEILTSKVTGVWAHLRDEHPEIYDKYFSMFGGMADENE